MNEDDQAYFEKRAKEERDRANAATDPALRRIHAAFATHYSRALRDHARDTQQSGHR